MTEWKKNYFFGSLDYIISIISHQIILSSIEIIIDKKGSDCFGLN